MSTLTLKTRVSSWTARSTCLSFNAMFWGAPHHRRLWAVCLAAMALFAVGCHGPDTSNRNQSIKIVREVILEGIRGQPNAIARMPDGTLVVAGVRGVAWAVGTSEDGKVLWGFEEPKDDKIETPYQ